MIDPIQTVDLFPVLDQKLITLLRSLSSEEWQRNTVSPSWNIYDIALHLLDGNIRGISLGRDRHFGVAAEGTDTYVGLVSFLNQLNHDWVKAGQRISPPLLIHLLDLTNKEYFQYLKTLDPEAEALFPVAWAGEQTSPNWFHIAREYTEKYHHQQQIRQALGKEAELMTSFLYVPFMDTLIRALPHFYADQPANTGTTILIKVSDGNGQWYLTKNTHGWELYRSCPIHPSCSVTIDKRIAWRLFTKGISKEEALKYLDIQGKNELGIRLLDVVAVMAEVV